MSEWTAARIREVLVRHLDPLSGFLMTEFELDGGKCDVVQLSKSGYATEYEIKISRADWRGDAEKEKWQVPRPHIRRFYYVIPADLIDEKLGDLDVPSSVAPSAGIIVVYETRGGFDALRTFRKAQLLEAQKVDDQTQRRSLLAAYYRYWRHVADMARVREQVRERRVTCPKCSHRMRCTDCGWPAKGRLAA